MSENSSIEWTDHTFNPWIGCTKVSPGCLHCYAEVRDRRHLQEPVDHWGPGAPRYRTSANTWRNPLRWNRVSYMGFFRQCPECGWRGEVVCDETDCPTEGCSCAGLDMEVVRPRVFCASLADWLDDDGVIEWFARLMELVAATPQIDWLLLTKRPQNWKPRIMEAMKHLVETGGGDDGSQELFLWCERWIYGGNPPHNVWIGTTVEDQTRANERIPKLLEIPARVRFLSCEPLLGSLDLQAARLLACPNKRQCFKSDRGPERLVVDSTEGGLLVECACSRLNGIHWVIAGGESGLGKGDETPRPMHPDWARALRDQCAAASVPFFFKQWGEWKPVCEGGDSWVDAVYRSNRIAEPHEDQGAIDELYRRHCIVPNHILHSNGKQWAILDEEAFRVTGAMQMFRVGKKAAGRLLDAVEHSAWPAGEKDEGGRMKDEEARASRGSLDDKRQDAASMTEEGCAQ